MLLVVQELQILAVQVVHYLNGRLVVGVLTLHLVDETVVGDTVLAVLEFVEFLLNTRVFGVEEPVFHNLAIDVFTFAVVNINLGLGVSRRNVVLLGGHLQQRVECTGGINSRSVEFVTRLQLLIGDLTQLRVALGVVYYFEQIVCGGTLGPLFKAGGTASRTRFTFVGGRSLLVLGVFVETPVKLSRLVFGPDPRLRRVVVADVVFCFLDIV